MADLPGMYSLEEFVSRGVIKLAPDAIVMINNAVSSKVMIKADPVNFRDGVSSITVNNLMEPSGGSTATINIVAPIYKGKHQDYWTNYLGASNTTDPIFAPMQEVRIYFKGRFLVNNQSGKPEAKYYPVFWGFVNTVENGFAGGAYNITLNCVDMLKWWEYQVVQIKPTPNNAGVWPRLSVGAFETIFKQKNVFEIMVALINATSFARFAIPDLYGQSLNYPTTAFPEDIYRSYQVASGFWDERFQIFSTNLRMFGLSGTQMNVQVVKDKQADGTLKPQLKIIGKNTDAKFFERIDNGLLGGRGSGGPVIEWNTSDSWFQRYMPFFDLMRSWSFEESEARTYLEVVTAMKNGIQYEFYQDTNGDLIFKPPFYNLDVRNIYPYDIKPLDILSYSFSMDPDQIVTYMMVSVAWGPGITDTAHAYYGTHVDVDKLAKFGFRYRKMSIPSIYNATLAQSLAVGYMSQANAKAYTGSITIAGRPEMKLGYPVYLPHLDAFYYVKGITHSLEFGGSFTTTLAVEAERKRVYEADKAWYDINKAKIATSPDPVPTLQKDKVYRQTKNYDLKDFFLDDNQGGIRHVVKADLDAIQKAQGKTMSQRQGGYEIEDRNKKTGIEEYFVTPTTVPFTDEEGYRVIGGFPYGRGLALSIDFPALVEPVAGGTPNSNVQNLKILNTIARSEGAREEAIAMTGIHNAMGGATSSRAGGPVEKVVPDFLRELPKTTTNVAKTITDEKQRVTQKKSRKNIQATQLANQPLPYAPFKVASTVPTMQELRQMDSVQGPNYGPQNQGG